MAMQTDISVISLTAGGTAYPARTRVRGLFIEPSGTAGNVILRDGGSSGVARMTFGTLANGQPFNVFIPAEGVLFYNDVYVDMSNANATVFYG